MIHCVLFVYEDWHCTGYEGGLPAAYKRDPSPLAAPSRGGEGLLWDELDGKLSAHRFPGVVKPLKRALSLQSELNTN